MRLSPYFVRFENDSALGGITADVTAGKKEKVTL